MNYTKFMEALKGKQHKIDKNKNGKIDAHDFKLLRKEEVEELDEGVDPSEVAGNPKMYDAATVKKAYYHKSATPEDKKTLERHLDRHHGMNNWRKPIKEETISEATVKTQKYSWGTMKTVHHGSDFSIPLHPEHHQAIAKLKDEQEHKFKDETGRHWTARRKGNDVHFQGANGGSSTKVPHSTMSEEVKDPTPVAPTLDKKYIKGTPEHKAYKATKKPINGMPTGKYNEEVELDEKLNPSMGAGEYIKDFQKSDAPQFAGKSKEKRRVMGIAAYLQAKRNVKEEAEPVEEGIKDLAKKAFKALTGGSDEDQLKALQKRAGAPVTGKKPVKEEIEELDEKSEQARKNKIMKNVMDASKGAKYNRDSGLKLTPGDTGHSTTQQMNKALGRHLRREDIEEAAPVVVKVNHALEAPHEETWEDTGICPEHNKKDCHQCGKGSMKENTGKSYKEFMMMLEYESDKSGSYKHTGTYGSEYAKKEREKDENFADEITKRGPKLGSKRGPKANLGSSKLHTK